jgi:hypothetical protein
MATTINYDIVDKTHAGSAEEGDCSSIIEQITQSAIWNSAIRPLGGYGEPILRLGTISTKSGESEKSRAFHIYSLTVPTGADLRRVTLTNTSANPVAGSTVDGFHFCLIKVSPATVLTDVFPAYGTGAGEMNSYIGGWSVTGEDNQFAHKMIQPIFEVRDTGGSAVGTPSVEGPSNLASGGQPECLVDIDGMKSLGCSLVAPAGGFTLGEVRWRNSRATIPFGGDSSASKTLVCEVYNVVSAANPRTTGSRIAVSDDFPWNDLKDGSVPAATPTSAWAIFTFSGGNQIEFDAGERYAIRVVEKDQDTLPVLTGGPYMRVSFDSGIAGGAVGTPTISQTNSAHGLFWGGGGMSRAAYPYERLFPQPYENFQHLPTDLLDANLDILFNGGTDPFAPNVGNGPLNDGVTAAVSQTPALPHVFGEDLDAGGGIDTVVDDFVQLFTDWINASDVGDGTPYDETGQRTLLVGEVVAVAGSAPAQWSTHDGQPTGGAVLSITWVEPAPGPATNPDPADASGCRPLNQTLSWDTGSGIVRFHDVHFGTSNPPPPVAIQAVGDTTYDPGPLSEGTTYFWEITERNTDNSTEGTVWSFTTCTTPTKATSPDPADTATDVDANPTLSWTPGSGCDLTYDVYFSTSPDPSDGPQGNQAGTSFVPAGPLLPGTTYFWRIDPTNVCGTVTGDVWSFTTALPELGAITGRPDHFPAISGKTDAKRAISGDTDAKRAISGDTEANPAIKATPEADPALSGGTDANPALSGGTDADPALSGGTDANRALAADPEADTAIKADAEAEQAISGRADYKRAITARADVVKNT